MYENLRNHLREPNVVRTLGLVSLVVANVSAWLARRSGNPDAYDLGVGVLFGIAIGTLLLSLRMQVLRRRDGTGPGAPA